MPWQRQVARVALEIDPKTQLPAYRTVILTVPRQSGKSTLLLSAFLQRCMSDFWKAQGRADGRLAGRQRCLYAAQTMKDARSKWEEDYVADMEASPRLAGKFSVYRGSGRESIRFPNSSQIGITANTEKAAHGKVLDLPVIDEAFALVDDRLDQAFVPAMSTRRQAQLWIVSTAGTPDSLYLKAKVERGRAMAEAGETSKIAYFEWSAPDDVDPDDEAAWALCMPALGYTIDLDVVRNARATLSESEFRRAYLNQWVDRDAGERVISRAAWAMCLDVDSEVTGNAVLAIDTSRERTYSAVSMAGGRPDGRVHVQTLAHGGGTSWVVAEVGRLRGELGARHLVLDQAGPAASLIPDLVVDGWVLGETLIVTGAAQMAQACGAFYDAVVDDVTVRHIGQKPLDDALQAARKRELLDTWAWGRKQSGADITPLVSVTLAHWGLATQAQATYDPLLSFF